MSRNRLLAIALFVSVAVNIFAVAVFLGPVMHRGGMMGPRDGMHHGLGPRQLEHLSDESRDQVRDIWRDSRRALHREFRAMIAARRALTAALTAPSYDENAVIAAQQQVDQAMDRVRALTNQAVLDSARILSDHEREEFFEYGFFPDRPPHRRGERYEHHDDD